MNYTFAPSAPAPLLRRHLHLGGSNPKGEQITVTSRYLERNARPWLPVMGEYHFVRDNRENWYRELCKMKAGGVDLVATYLFWIYHEEEEGKLDFSGDRDIRAFVLDAKRAGLEVVLRLGPWAHGECRNGGFPDWLLQKPFPLERTAPRPRPPGRPASSGGGCRWTGHPGSAGSPPHTARPVPARICRSRTRPQCPRSGAVGCPHQCS